MSYPIYMPSVGSSLAADLDKELSRAERLFPNQETSVCLIALMEEVGELCKAYLEDTPNFQAEAIQVAVMAIRCIKSKGNSNE